MKNLTFFIVMLFSIALSAQKDPGKNPEVLVGKQLKIASTPTRKLDGFQWFFTDAEQTKVFSCCGSGGSYHSTFESLDGRTFKVDEVTHIKNGYYSIKITDAKGTLYYKYNSSFTSDFPFEIIGGLQPAATNACSLIGVTNDAEFDVYTAVVEDIAIMKQFDKVDKSVKYFLRIAVQSTTLKKDIKTAVVMMENNKEISRTNAQVEMKVADNGKYEYTTYIELTNEEVALLKSNKVFAALISTFDARVTKGSLFKELVNCLESK